MPALRPLCALLGLAFLAPQAYADCTPFAPTSGQTVQCVGAAAVGVYAPSASHVAVSVPIGTDVTFWGITLGPASEVTNEGSISAGGIGVAAGPGGGSSVQNLGTISLSSSSSIGIDPSGQGTVVNSGTILTTGANDSGIYSSSAGPLAGSSGGTIRNTGAIEIAGPDYGFGIFVSGNQSIINSGQISTAADASMGVGLSTNMALDHPTLLNQPGGLIQTHGAMAPAILATLTTSSLATVSITNAGTVESSGAQSDAVSLSVLVGNGVASLTNSGTIAATGAGADAVRLNGLSIYYPAPDTTVSILNETGGIIQSAQANAIESAIGSTLLVNKGTIYGDVTLASDAQNRVTLYGGSRIAGQLLLGTDPDSTLVLAGSTDATLAQAVSGTVQAGALIKEGSATWTLDRPIAANSSVTVNAGRLVLDTPLPQSAVLVQGGGALAGLGSMASLDNRGSVAPGSPTTPFASLTVLGNYTGTGRLVFDTILAGSGGQASRLVVDGSTSGARAEVVVNNLGGSGGLTSGNGIALIEVGGASDPKAFAMRPLQVGPYVYTLDEGGSTGSGGAGSWYLRSVAGELYRSMRGGYFITRDVTSDGSAALANQAFARSAFTMSLYDRLGNQQPAVGLDGDGADGGRPEGVWARLAAASVHWDAQGTATDTANYAIQFGSDLWDRALADGAEVRLGVMAGYTDLHGSSTAAYDNQSALVGANGLAAGVYGTWFEDARRDRGAYVDSWMIAGGRNAWVSTASGRVSSSQGQSKASIEAGYSVAVAGGQLVITPQLQAIYNDLFRRSLQDANGAALVEGGTSWTSRLGVRIAGSASADHPYAPFLGVNLWRDSNAATVTDDGTSYSSTLPRQRVELLGGIDWRLSSTAALSTHLELQSAAHGYRSTAAQLALKVAL